MTDISTANGLGLHAAFIEEKLPAWIKHSHRKDLVRLRTGAVLGHEPLPDTHLADAPITIEEIQEASKQEYESSYLDTDVCWIASGKRSREKNPSQKTYCHPLTMNY